MQEEDAIAQKLQWIVEISFYSRYPEEVVEGYREGEGDALSPLAFFFTMVKEASINFPHAPTHPQSLTFSLL